MLTFFDRSHRASRRAFLQVGSLGLGGLSLPGFLAAKAAAAQGGPPLRDKSVIFLFLHGGPSQLETFDPKMTAPAEIRSATGEIPTTLPGITFGGTFPKLAAQAQRLAIVRSFTTGDGNHDIKPIVGRNTRGANMGSLYARVAGANHPETGIPTNIALFPRALEPSRLPPVLQFGNFMATGSLGSAMQPFVPGGGGDLQKNLELTLPRDRLDDRRLLLGSLDRIRREADATGMLAGMDRFQEQAFTAIVNGAAQAFDLSQEDPATVAAYDTHPLLAPGEISRKWNNHKNYVDNAQTLGKLLLLARRLCERGCGFVTVTTNFVWDMHADSNNAGVDEGMQYMGRPLDHALGAFLEDVHQRGLSDKILLVACGEMGRTPRINKNGGRDHWGGSAPLLFAGGGLKMGQVIGQSTADAGQPATEPVRLDNLTATVMHSLIDMPQLRLERGIPDDVMQPLFAADPIPQLV